MRRDEHLLDLLAARSTEGLSREQAVELDDVLAGRDDPYLDEFDAAAAAIYLAFEAAEGDDEPMPEHLRRRVLRDARGA